MTQGFTRVPGTSSLRNPHRMDDIANLADLLHETSLRHGPFEAAATEHDWWDWYAAYMDARRRGQAPDEASTSAGAYMATLGVGPRQ